uniref:Protein kinase domain-containing protein n=1 Tax=Sinocyclocheilus grahami TaxID=75366 RepID=A0A672LPC5_SINGR
INEIIISKLQFIFTQVIFMGEGSYGSVYEGTRCEDGLQVAVKFTAKTENEPYISLVSELCSLCHRLCQTSWSTQRPWKSS